MARRKDYSIKTEGATVSNLDEVRQAPWRQTWAGLTTNFNRWRYIGRPKLDENDWAEGLVHANRDEIVEAMRKAVWEKVVGEKTKVAYCSNGLSRFFLFLDNLYSAGECICGLKQINKRLLERFNHWMAHTYVADTKSGRLSYGSRANTYKVLKPLLQHLVHQQALPEGIFPNNPYPNSNRAFKGETAYPKKVMAELLRALGQDIKGIRDGSLKINPSEVLTVYILIIAARSGRNPTPLINATRDALMPHPVKPTTMGLLVLYKNRGGSTSFQGFQKPSIEVEDMVSLPMDAMTLFHEVSGLTAPLVSEAAPEHQDRLWLYRSTEQRSKGQVKVLAERLLLNNAKRIVERHQLKDVDGTPLKLNIMKLRKTFNQRMWQLTDGDIIKTAQLAGNTPKVNDRHYLAVTPEMEVNHRNMGHVMHAELTGATDDKDALHTLSKETGIAEEQLLHIVNGDNNTGVGRCADPQNGELAPHDGTDCTSWLNCFKCSSQVVIESDLYRLFSFYFLLLKERNLMVRRRWESTYGKIISIIDDEIVTPNLRNKDNPKGCFDPLRVKKYRDKAEADPHPMWRDRAILALNGGMTDVE